MQPLSPAPSSLCYPGGLPRPGHTEQESLVSNTVADSYYPQLKRSKKEECKARTEITPNFAS